LPPAPPFPGTPHVTPVVVATFKLDKLFLSIKLSPLHWKIVFRNRPFRGHSDLINVKEKESRNRAGVAQRVPGGLGSQISMTFGT